MKTFAAGKRHGNRSPSSSGPTQPCSGAPSRPIRPLPRRRLAHTASLQPQVKPALAPSPFEHHRSPESDPFLSSTELSSTSEDDLGTALSDIESVVHASPRYSTSVTPDRDGEEVDDFLLKAVGSPSPSLSPKPTRSRSRSRSMSTPTSLPTSPKMRSRIREKGKMIDPEEHMGRERKKFRTSESEGEADDEAEVGSLLGYGSGRRTGKRPAVLQSPPHHVEPTPSIIQITNGLHDMTADSVYEIELHDKVDADLVSSSLVAIPPSPTPAPAPPAGPSKKKKRPAPRYSVDVINAVWQAVIRPGPYKSPQALCAVAHASGDAAALPVFPDVDVQPVQSPLALDSDVEMSEVYDSPMDVSDVEVMTKAVLFSPPRQVQRRPKHLTFCERLPGQHSTANLRRFSPTSLLPMREKPRRKHALPAHAAHATLGSRLFCVKQRVKQSRQPSTCIGQAVMGVIIERRKRQIHRRDLVKEYNARTRDGQWRSMVNAWNGARYVRSIVDGLWWRRTWQFPVPPAIDGGDIATVAPRQLQASDPADPAGERATTNDDYDLPEDLAEAEAVAIDASVHTSAPISVPTAHVDLQRIGSTYQSLARIALAGPVRPQTRRITPGREELRRLRAEAAWQRLVAEEREVEEAEHAMEDQRREERERREEEERDRREEEERERETRQRARMVVAEDRILDHLEQDRLARSARNSGAPSASAHAVARPERLSIASERVPHQVVAAVRSRSPSVIAGPSTSRERSISPAPTDRSDPPEYDSEHDLPVLMPYPVRLGAPLRRRPDPPVLLPEYIDDVYRYSRRSPSPPPPYNAHTDRQTLVAPVFIDEDEDNDDQRVLDGLPGLLPVAEPIIVGAFPGAHAAPAVRQEPAYRNGFDAALDIEEGVAGDEEEQVEGLFGDEGAGEAEVVPVLGAIGGWLGRVWRW